MQIQIASDLHLEGYRDHMPDKVAFCAAPERDVLVLAGDIGQATQGRDFVLRELARSPVIYIPGNHEYYLRRSRDRIDSDWRALAAENPDLHYLVAAGVSIDGVRFWGAPWYSDLWGIDEGSGVGVWRLRAIERGITDFWRGFGEGAWSMTRHIGEHRTQTRLLEAQAGRVDVVITHWPPTKGALHPRFEGDSLNPYFINDRPDLVRKVGAKLWISGHTHEAYDYMEGATRCIGNPTGYQGEKRHSLFVLSESGLSMFEWVPETG